MKSTLAITESIMVTICNYSTCLLKCPVSVNAQRVEVFVPVTLRQ